MATAVAATFGTTDYHSKYFAAQIALRVNGDSPDKLATSLADAVVDLNPHQIDAALFAFQSPLSNGVVLADEVGLGKTIEAGLVISQYWAERKRRILILTPANLRKQWLAELQDKFHLPCIIVEGASYAQGRRSGTNENPFDLDGRELAISSIPFGSGKADDLERVPWDLVVIDEAHRLRNPGAKQHQRLKKALRGRKKLLLTATPLQNNLIELWGLAGLIDEHFFGDRSAFQKRYGGQLDQAAFDDLRYRLKPLVQRTLRRDASEFISYPDRIAMLEEFVPTPEEEALYDLVSEYLRRPQLHALPTGQRHLMTMVLRKLLASSTFAIASALRTMSNRLQRNLADLTALAEEESLIDDFSEDFDPLEETLDEWDDETLDLQIDPTHSEVAEGVRRELLELEMLATQAEQIAHNAKVTALITGLRKAFEMAEKKGAARKAIVFTESRRTQEYLDRVLSGYPEFADGILRFDGSNSDPRSREIFAAWRARYEGTDRISGSRTADMRAALVDCFREHGQIMLATEAAAEGINLQFCSLVINYDLPWNPQRIEQRIGRAHRYGQKHDVIVLNFLNKKNEADQRVYELLDEKFHLFNGVFGATDEVLGSIGSGVDIERRIAGIYQQARTKEEIDRGFQQMQLDLEDQITEKRELTERKLFEHFDQDVAERFRSRKATMDRALSRIERLLIRITRHELRDVATFEGERSFHLRRNPFPERAIPTGSYRLLESQNKTTAVASHLYRPGHPLAQGVIEAARERELEPGRVTFSYGATGGRQSAIEPLIGCSGWLAISRLAIEMDAGGEDHLLLAGFTDDGAAVDAEQIDLLFRLRGHHEGTLIADAKADRALETSLERARIEAIERMEVRLAEWVDQEQRKLDAWADDRRANLVGDIDKLDKQIRQLRRDIRTAVGLRERHEKQKEINALTRKRDDLEDKNRERRREIEREQEALLDRAWAQVNQTSLVTPLMTIRWTLSP